MKRKQEEYPGLKKIFPRFFWRFCSKCGLEFKGEPGWKYDEWNKITKYVCGECCPSADIAFRYFNPFKYFKKIPPPKVFKRKRRRPGS